MPHGCSGVVMPLVETLANRMPWDGAEAFIDLGCGRGMMGAVVRTFWPHKRMFGIEGQERYRTAKWGDYEHVWIGDLREVVPQLIAEGQRFQYGMFFEVLEHLAREDGAAVLAALPELADHWFMSTPDRFFEVAGNAGWGVGKYDPHVCCWAAEELQALGWQIINPHGGRWEDLGLPMFMAYRGTWDLAGIKAFEVEP